MLLQLIHTLWTDFKALSSSYSTFTQIFALIATIWVLYVVPRIIYAIMMNIKYARVARKFLDNRNANTQRFVEQYGDTVSLELQKLILDSSATQLLELFKQGKATSEQALITYALRAIKVSIPFNYAADFCLDVAMKHAKEKDQQRKENPNNLPPLHGLPISIKDHTTCKDLTITAGFRSSLLMQNHGYDCNYVRVIREQGAIPFMSSNVPQGLGAIETSNHLFGRAPNPWNPARSCGGSSGGEAGLISTKCSPIGIASDAAGSIRIPSHFCGVYGFAPTPGRVSLKRTLNIREIDSHYFREIGCSYGPIASTVDDLVLISKAVYGNFGKWDFDTVPLPWNEKKYQETLGKKLTIGYTLDSDLCEPHAAIKNAILETVEKLRQEGHTCIEVEHGFTEKTFLIGLSLMLPYGIGTSVRHILKWEAPGTYYYMQFFLSIFPKFVQKIMVVFLKIVGEKRFSRILAAMRPQNIKSFFDVVQVRENMKDEFLDMWYDKKVDCMISPVLPFTAIRHGTSELVNGLIGSTFLYNALGFPCGVVPIRRVKKEEESYSSVIKDFPALMMKIQAKGSEGLPVGIQIASMTFEDEKCLALMKQVENIFNYHEVLRT